MWRNKKKYEKYAIKKEEDRKNKEDDKNNKEEKDKEQKYLGQKREYDDSE